MILYTVKPPDFNALIADLKSEGIRYQKVLLQNKIKSRTRILIERSPKAEEIVDLYGLERMTLESHIALGIREANEFMKGD